MDQTDNPLPHGSVNVMADDWYDNTFFLSKLDNKVLKKAVLTFKKKRLHVPDLLLAEVMKRMK